MSEVGKINFVDFSDGLPAFLTIIMMPLTGSIANGFAFGFVSYVFMKRLSASTRRSAGLCGSSRSRLSSISLCARKAYSKKYKKMAS